MEILPRQYVTYQEFKQALDSEMTRVAVGFVRIGFMLNYAEKTGIIKEGGYENIADFVKAEYEIDETQISRFARIYSRFGVPGEPRLKDQYMNHGVAKLGVMLTLPDVLNEEIGSGYSRSEINVIKHEYEEEQKVTPVELEIEKQEMEGTVQYLLPEGLEQTACQLFHDEPGLYVKLYSSAGVDDLKEILVPAGEQCYFVRIKGVGRMSVFMKSDAGITVMNMREVERKQQFEWQQLFGLLKEWFAKGGNAEESWSSVFQEPFPKKEEPAKEDPVNSDKSNVQQLKPKKEPKVKVVAPRPKKKPKAEPKVEEPAKEQEEQLPGQINIMDCSEYLPESMKADKPEVLTGEVLSADDAAKGVAEGMEKAEEPHNDNVQQDSGGMKVEYIAPVQNDNKNIIRGYKAGIRQALKQALDECDKDDWTAVIAKATSIVWRAKKIQELEEKN